MLRYLSILFVGFIFIPNEIFAGFPLYDLARQPKKECNETKVINKVPVYEFCSRNTIEYENLVIRNDVDETTRCNEHGAIGNYVVGRNVLSKVVIFKNMAFALIPRLLGVPSTLNWFSIDQISNDKICPKLKCYPDCKVNQLALPGTCPDSPYYLTNVVDIQIDKCRVLYAFDMGSYMDGSIFEPVFIQAPQICRYNLSVTDEDPLINCQAVPENLYALEDLHGFTTIIVNTLDDKCVKTFVYIINVSSGKLIVYSVEMNAFWAFDSIWLRPEPHDMHFKVTLPDYSCKNYVVWSGVSGVLSDSKLIYSVRPSRTLYHVPTKLLNDQSNTNIPEFDYNINEIGMFNERGQTNSMVLFKDVIFGAQEQQHAIVCFNTSAKVSPDNIQFIIKDRHKFPYITDVRFNTDKPGCKRVYFLSNNKLDIECNGLNSNVTNFRIFYFKVKEALELYPECKGYYKDIYQQYKTQTIQYHQEKPIEYPQYVPTCHKHLEQTYNQQHQSAYYHHQ